MRPAETIARLAAFGNRGAGADAERRAAQWLADELQEGGRDARGDLRREVRLEPFWCRPNWALAHTWHLLLGLAGSLLSVSTPRVGGALVLAALCSVIADELTGASPGRRLTPERASQNVVAEPRQPPDDSPLRLIITANYDAGRTGLAYRMPIRRAARRLLDALGGLSPGWLGWLSIALVWLLVIALLRAGGARGAAVGAAQLIPTVALVLALALLLELATADSGAAANDNASGVAVAVAVARALDAAPPRHVSVELVLQGAGEGGGIGLRRYLDARKRTLTRADTVVIGIAPSGAGTVRWWQSDGPFVPLPYLERLRELCARVAADEPHLEAQAHRGRGATPALPARAARLPAIAIGCVDDRGLVPLSHQREDTADQIDPAALDATVEFALMVVDAVDAFRAAYAVGPA